MAGRKKDQGKMRKLFSHMMGIDQGSTVLFSDFEDGGPMWAETGPRECVVPVRFKEPFRDPPVVHVGLSMWDMDQKTNARADISAENIAEGGFDIVFRTWGDTRVARVRASWMAIGEIPYGEEWDLS